MKKETRTGEDRIITVPNVISFIRLLCIPTFFVVYVTGNDLVALSLLAFTFLTDFLDGFIARKFNQVTAVGKVLDPMADRLLIFFVLLGFTIRGVVPFLFTLAVIARECFLVYVGVYLAKRDYGMIPVNYIGKTGTALVDVSVVLYFLTSVLPADISYYSWVFTIALSLWAVILYWISAFVYFMQAKNLIRE